VTPVPFYWYIEPGSLGDSFQDLPWSVFGPTPTFTEIVLFDDATGEIHGEAILMRALPWPRFRRFSDGSQVLLPYWTAISLERLESHSQAFGLPTECPCGVYHGTDRTYHFRVEVTDRESVHLSTWDNAHFEAFLPSRAKRNVGAPRRAALSYREAKLRDQ